MKFTASFYDNNVTMIDEILKITYELVQKAPKEEIEEIKAI